LPGLLIGPRGVWCLQANREHDEASLRTLAMRQQLLEQRLERRHTAHAATESALEQLGHGAITRPITAFCHAIVLDMVYAAIDTCSHRPQPADVRRYMLRAEGCAIPTTIVLTAPCCTLRFAGGSNNGNAHEGCCKHCTCSFWYTGNGVFGWRSRHRLMTVLFSMWPPMSSTQSSQVR
jgi:hypothetical protein